MGAASTKTMILTRGIMLWLSAGRSSSLPRTHLRTLVREIERCSELVGELAFSLDGAMLAVAERSNSDYPNGGVAIYLRSSDDAPVSEPTPRPTRGRPTSRPTFRPTLSPRDESDGARTASMAWAALLLVAWLA